MKTLISYEVRGYEWDHTHFQTRGYLKDILVEMSVGAVPEPVHTFVFEADSEKELRNFDIIKLYSGFEVPPGYFYVTTLKKKNGMYISYYYKATKVKEDGTG